MKNTRKPRLVVLLAESLGLAEAVEKNDYETCRERLRSADFQTVVTLANGEHPFGERHWLYDLADAEKRRRRTAMHEANAGRNQATRKQPNSSSLPTPVAKHALQCDLRNVLSIASGESATIATAIQMGVLPVLERLARRAHELNDSELEDVLHILAL
jgi:hypothetical protein